MTTFAHVGAGPGLELAAARRFGAAGHSVALISRDAERLEHLASELGRDGIQARGFTADVLDPATLTTALRAAVEALGPIEILQYSPVPRADFMKPVLDTSADDLDAPLAFSVKAPLTCVNAVLPGMRALGRGTLLFVNGSSAVRPAPNVAGTSIAFAAESAYAAMLHDVMMGGLALANVVGVPIGSFAGRPAGWRGPFWALAVLSALAAVFAGRSVPRTEQHADVSVRAEVRALRRGRLWPAPAAAVLIMGGVLATYTYMTPLLTDRAGIPEGTVPLILIAFGIGALGGTAIGGRLGDRRPMATAVPAAAATAWCCCC